MAFESLKVAKIPETRISEKKMVTEKWTQHSAVDFSLKYMADNTLHKKSQISERVNRIYLWCVCRLDGDTQICGNPVEGKPVVWVMKEITRVRTKKIEVHWIHLKEAADRTTKQRLPAIRWWQGVTVVGQSEGVWELMEFFLFLFGNLMNSASL